jgi:23S rRNA (pseudouridine1915-N3)-methyltransferase
MQINLISVGTKMPGWVQQGYQEYAKRMPRECELILREIIPGKRGKNVDIVRSVQDEGRRMLSAIKPGMHVVSLDVRGKGWSTVDLSKAMEHWLENGRHVALLVGGPEGLAEPVRQASHQSWSLSAMTLPHPLVRIIVAEQIYRAWSILKNHPYHR